MRQPLDVGCNPDASNSTPALAISSWYVAIAAISWSSGNLPDSVSLLPLTIMRNRISLSLGSICSSRCSYLLANAILLCAELRRELLAEVICFEHRADLDFTLPLHRIGAAPHPFDGFLKRLHLPQPRSRDELLSFAERSVNDPALRPIKFHASAFELGCKPSAASMIPAFTNSH